MDKKQEEHAEGTVTAKRKRLYTVLVTACALVLAAAIALTIVLTVGGSVETPVSETPGNTETPSDNDTADETQADDEDEEEDEPSSTEIVFALPVSGATVTTGYEFWLNTTLNRYTLHTGIDFSVEAGTAVTASYGGTIESITHDLLEGGKIIIDHGDGLKTVYASIDVNEDLRVGDTVAKGDVIGTVSAASDAMGNEYDEGSHLHFEVWQEDKAIDPNIYLDLDEK